jgi:hypothetical protein
LVSSALPAPWRGARWQSRLSRLSHRYRTLRNGSNPASREAVRPGRKVTGRLNDKPQGTLIAVNPHREETRCARRTHRGTRFSLTEATSKVRGFVDSVWTAAPAIPAVARSSLIELVTRETSIDVDGKGNKFLESPKISGVGSGGQAGFAALGLVLLVLILALVGYRAIDRISREHHVTPSNIFSSLEGSVRSVAPFEPSAGRLIAITIVRRFADFPRMPLRRQAY